MPLFGITVRKTRGRWDGLVLPVLSARATPGKRGHGLLVTRRFRSERPIDGLGDPAAEGHHLAEGGGGDRLGAVAEGVLGVVVDLDDQRIGAGGDRRPWPSGVTSRALPVPCEGSTTTGRWLFSCR